MSEIVLSVQDVTKSYQVGKTLTKKGATLHALRGIDLDVRNGETLGLVGESGCGKTTLARLILGIEAATTGTVMFGGKSIAAFGRLERAKLVQPVFQDPYASLNPRTRISGIVAAPLEVRGIGSSSSRRERTRRNECGRARRALHACLSQPAVGRAAPARRHCARAHRRARYAALR
jgi:peptide/nickel transport system ATP-binding protein